jgi:exodeoxyribonuclease VIII
MHIMLDIETMGTGANAPIWAIGAVRFDADGVSDDHFYETISLASAVAHGADMDPDTVVWWLKQSDAARNQLTDATGDMNDALDAFATWVNAIPPTGVWGNGAGFDNALLAQAYRRRGHPAPWPFYLDRCYRTEKSLSAIRMADRQGTHHNAIDDAQSQAQHLIEIWAARESTGKPHDD